MVIKKQKNINSISKLYSTKGYVVIRGLVDKSDIEKIKIDLNKLIEKNLNKKDKREINKINGNAINSLHNLKNWQWTKKVQNDTNLKYLVKNLLNDDVGNFGAELFAKPPKVGLAVPPHQDNYYWCLSSHNALTVWIAIDESNKKNGAIYYYEKSQELGLLEHTPSFVPGSSQVIKYQKPLSLFKKITPTLLPGDCIIHNSVIVHGSTANRSINPRKGWTIRYKAKSSKIDPFLQKKYELELRRQVDSRSR